MKGDVDCCQFLWLRIQCDDVSPTKGCWVRAVQCVWWLRKARLVKELTSVIPWMFKVIIRVHLHPQSRSHESTSNAEKFRALVAPFLDANSHPLGDKTTASIGCYPGLERPTESKSFPFLSSRIANFLQEKSSNFI